MEPEPRPFRLEALLAHREWVERAARALVFGDADAQDLGQQAWLEVLERPPAGAPESPRGWLRAVLRFTAIDAGRAARTRRIHEEAAARGERVDADPADVVAQAETLDRVVHAVLELQEPYRTTVLLRYFRDLPPRAIASMQGVPVETVRTRLKRAMAQLRERLDTENEGDRRRWCLALLPFLRHPSPGATATGGSTASALAGGLLMGMKAKVTVAAVVLALLGTGLALRETWRGTEPPAAPRPRAGVGRPVSVPLDRGTQANRGEAPPVEAGTRPVVATVQDRRGRAVAGVSLRLASGEEVLGSTGPDGQATLQVPAQGQGRILAGAEGFVQAGADFGPRTSAIDIRLDAGTRLTVKVVSEGGAPLGRARVLGRPQDLVTYKSPGTGLDAPLPERLALTDDAGIAIVWRIPDARYWVMAEHEGSLSKQEVQPVEGRVTLTLRACDLVTGVVVDEAGQQVAGVLVQATSYSQVSTHKPWEEQFHLPVRSDKDGRFSVPVVRSALQATVQAHPEGYAGSAARLQRSDAAQPWGEARIVLLRGLTVEVRLKSPANTPRVDRVHVRIARKNATLVHEAEVTVDGTIAIVRGIKVWGESTGAVIQVDARVLGLSGMAALDLPEASGARVTVDVALSRLREAKGRFVGEDGEGLRGCRVVVHGYVTASVQEDGSFGLLLPPVIGEDADVTLIGPGNGFITVVGYAGETLWQGKLREVTATGSFQVPGVVTLHGLLTLSDGSPCAGGSVYVMPFKPDPPYLRRFYEGLQGLPDAVSDESGRFPLVVRKGSESSVVACAAGAAPTAVTSREFAESGVLRLDPGCVLFGTVLSDSGEPVAFADLNLHLVDDHTFMFLQVASEEGQFAFVGLPVGRKFSLSAYAKGFDLQGILVRTEGAEMRADLTLRKLGILSLRVVTTDGVPCSQGSVRYQGSDRGTMRGESLDEKGGCIISGEVGEYRLLVAPRLFREKGTGGIQFLPVETTVRPERGVVEEVRVEPAVWIRGRVSGPGGDPVAGAELKLRMNPDLSFRDSQPRFSFDQELGYVCTTDEAGHFSVGVPKAGTYLADVTAKGYLPAGEASLSTGSEGEVTLRPKE